MLNKKQIHILHADDDQFLLDIYKPLFEKEGYKITDIKKLDVNFMQQVININPDLIISDITKPEISGMDFLRTLKADERTKNIPFVFLSNSSSEKFREEAKELGVIAHFVKAEMKVSEVVEEIKKLVK